MGREVSVSTVGAPPVITGEPASARTSEESRLAWRSEVSAVIWVAGPKIGSGALQLLINWLLVRHLGPAHSGVLFACITAIVLGDAVIGAALDMGVINLATGRDSASAALAVQKAALLAKCFGGLVLGVPVLLFARPLTTLLFHSEGDPLLLPLSVAALFGLLILRSVQTCFQVSGRFMLYGLTDVLHSLIKFGGISLLLVAGQASPLLVLCFFVAGPGLVALGFLLTAARGVLWADFSAEALRSLGRVARWMLGVGASGSVNSRMDILLVSSQAGAAQAGLLSAAQVMALPFQLAAMYLAVVFAPKVLPLWRTGRLGPIYARFQAALLAVAVSLFLAALLASGRIAAFLLPSAYRTSAGIFVLLLPAALAALVNFPWTISFLMFTHPRFLLATEILAFPLLLILYRVFITSQGAAGAAIVTSAFAVVKAILYQLLAGRAMKAGPREIDCYA